MRTGAAKSLLRASKPTITSLVGELVDLGLARESHAERSGAIGRPGLIVELDGREFAGIGIEVSTGHIKATALTPRGQVLIEKYSPLDVCHLDQSIVIDAVASLIKETTGELRRAGVRCVGAAVAAPGIVDPVDGIVENAPNIGWSHVPLIGALTERLGRSAPPLGLGNDARLAVIAEYLGFQNPDVHDLIYIIGGIGIGGGFISDGRLITGSSGLAGEIGHMPLDPGGAVCACGRRGCWETMVGLTALLRRAAACDDEVLDSTIDVKQRLDELVARADAGDRRTLAALDAVGADLGLGLSLLSDVMNPRAIVLGGYFTHVSRYVIDQVRAVMAARVITPRAGDCEVMVSTLGFDAVARGAACLAVDRIYQDPVGAAGRV
ncbi:ROK family protein [Actinospica robiniae]|uniref:ROK family protein n=1 Tax=Actinospica robiniae TaxID=304901 RepID=UPI000409334C|nr:ROK family protein [Actinospica robiniae]